MRPSGGDYALVSNALRSFGIVGELTSVQSLAGAANRVWRVACAQDLFVVKEFRYTIDDYRRLDAIQTAARFEHAVWESGLMKLAEPIGRFDGELLAVVPGSRGGLSAVRVHRWLDGSTVTRPGIEDAALAGGLLADVQRVGRSFAVAPSGTLRWWRWQPARVLDLLTERQLLGPASAGMSHEVLARAESLIDEGEARSSEWAFTHYDVKPANTLWVEGSLRAA